MKQCQVAIIGGGPAGYVAAIRASYKTDSVILIDKGGVGGTCLHWGCIPTKALLAQADLLEKVHNASEMGIYVDNVTFDFGKMMERKNRIVQELFEGVKTLIKTHGVTLIEGEGKLISPREIKVLGDTPEIIRAESIILATGSRPKPLPFLPFDGKQVHSSSSILMLQKLPQSLIIIGGGIIGCEFASLYSRLGVKVTLVEALPRLLMTEEEAIAQFLSEHFQKNGITIECNARIESAEKEERGVTLRIKDKGTVTAEQVLVAIGREPNTEQIGLENAAVATNKQGFISVNEYLETNVDQIYAIGDITGQWQLAHFASHQGMTAAINATGKREKIDISAVPSVIFTSPEIASVGMKEREAKEAGYDATTSRFPFSALGKARATGEMEGFVQIVFDRQYGQIVGAQVIGHGAETLIAEMALAIQNELTIDAIAETVHAHPTYAESWMEAAFLAQHTPLHLPKVK